MTTVYFDKETLYKLLILLGPGVPSTGKAPYSKM